MDQANNSPWWQEILNQKNVSATSSNAYPNSSGGSSNPLSGFGGNINSEQSNNSSPTGSFNPQSSVPAATTQQSAPASTSTGQANSSVGNTSSQTNTAVGINQSTNQTLLNPNQNQQQQNGQSSTGLSGFGNILSSLGGQAVSGFQKLTGIGGGVANGVSNSINDFGASLFGSGGGTAGYVNAAGDSVAAGSAGAIPVTASTDASLASSGGDLASAGGGTASLTGVLGGAGFGAGIGSLYGSIAGLQGANAGNADIGGALGGAAGAAVFGAEAGSIIPGLGTIIGAGAGAILGGLFGPGSAATNADGFGERIKVDGTLDSATSQEGSKNAGPVAGFGQASVNTFSTLAQSASSTLGIKFNPNLTIGAVISTKHPGPGGPAALGVQTLDSGGSYDSGKIFFNPQDNKSVADAYYKVLTDAAQQSGYTDSTALYNWFYGQGPLSDNNNTNATNNNVNIAPVGNYGNSGPIIA